MTRFALGAAALLLAGAASSASADPARSYVSGALGSYDVSATGDGSGEWGALMLRGATGWEFSGGQSLDIAGFWGGYGYENSEDPREQPEYSASVSAHFNFAPIGPARFGAFLAYGYSWLHDEHNYATYLAGLESQAMLGDVRLFGQVGYGDLTEGEQDDLDGFREGAFLRLGGEYYVSDDSVLGLEATGAFSSQYIDDGDDGEFYGVTARAETRLPGTANTSIGAFLNYNHYEAALGEEDSVNERILGVSLTYRFGQASARAQAQAGASIGAPSLPFYATAWGEQID